MKLTPSPDPLPIGKGVLSGLAAGLPHEVLTKSEPGSLLRRSPYYIHYKRNKK